MAGLKNNIALVDIEELKQYLQLDDDNDDTNPFLEDLINAASQVIENYCDRKFILVTTAIDEIWNGDGDRAYYTKYAPITATISTIYYWNGTAWTALTGETHTQDNNKGLIYFTDGNKFGKGSRNWKIEYIYGWSRANVPTDLKQACCEIIGRKKKLFEDNLHGVSSKSFGDQSITYGFNIIPADIKMMLDFHKRHTLL